MPIVDHILTEATQKRLYGGKEMRIRRAVVIHFTAGATAESSINFWKEHKQKSQDIGAHIIIERTGKIFQCRAFNKTISHAGKSRWDDPNDNNKHYDGCNGFTIGIELANAGNNPTVIKIASKLPGFTGVVKARHRNGGATVEWERFPEPQFLACADVVKQLVKQYNLDDITGHDCIAPERKNDPGPAFHMQTLREMCGFEGLPKVHY